MNRKLVLLVLVSVLIWTSFDFQLSELVAANPIPIPTLMMPEEYINVTIYPDEHGVVYAEVDGLYPFGNVAHEKVMMYYPIPCGSDEISVDINETIIPLIWRYSEETYPTVIGDFQMIEWMIAPVPINFEIRIHYRHPVLKYESYSFLYAMGTGRYLQSYAKETTAYVSININKEIAPTWRSIDIDTIGYYEGEWFWYPADYTITQDDDAWLISLTKVSAPFHPLLEDLHVTIRPSDSVSGINDGLELTMNIDKTTIVVGDVLSISFTLRNIGSDTLMVFFPNSQRFDVYLFYMGMPIARWSDGKVFLMYIWELYLEPDETFTGTLEWNLFQYNYDGYTPPHPSIYDISGVCVGKLMEMGPAVTTGKLTLELILPDINHDRIINILDISVVAMAFGSKLGDEKWNLIADLNDDDVVDVLDISIVAKDFGKTY